MPRSVTNKTQLPALGKVIDVEVSDNYEVREDTINDRFIKSSFSNKKDIILTIKGTPTVFDDRDIKFATVRVKIGEKRSENFLYLREKCPISLQKMCVYVKKCICVKTFCACMKTLLQDLSSAEGPSNFATSKATNENPKH